MHDFSSQFNITKKTFHFIRKSLLGVGATFMFQGAKQPKNDCFQARGGNNFFLIVTGFGMPRCGGPQL